MDKFSDPIKISAIMPDRKDEHSQFGGDGHPPPWFLCQLRRQLSYCLAGKVQPDRWMISVADQMPHLKQKKSG